MAESAIVRHTDAEPAPFAVGLDELAAVEAPSQQGAAGEQTRRAGLPPLPASEIQSAPFEVERYLGRVDEISPAGVVIATLWEVPSGRRGTASFTAEDTRFEPEPPTVGALLCVWAWSELSGDGEPVTRTMARVENRKLTDAERADLRRLLDDLHRESADG